MSVNVTPTSQRIYSRHARQALILLGSLIRTHRIERKLSVQALAERVCISRDMMQRIEQGDPRCTIGAVMEAATIVGVPLFDSASQHELTTYISQQQDKLRLLPKAIHQTKRVIKDDF